MTSSDYRDFYRDKTILITGASRGIGREIALRAAKDGANVVIAAKSDAPNPKLPGSIHSVAAEVEELGGRALALKLDVRDEENIAAVVREIQETSGRDDGTVCLLWMHAGERSQL